MKTDSVGAEVYDHTVVSDEPSAAYSRYEKRNAVVGIAYPMYLDGTKISQNADVDRREALGKFITEEGQEAAGPRLRQPRLGPSSSAGGSSTPSMTSATTISRAIPSLLDKLADDFVASKFDVKGLYRTIVASQPYQITSATVKENEKDETLFSHMALKPMTPEQLFDSLITATAAHKAAGGNFDAVRNQWLGQFTVTFANDEEGENSNFQGTIPQALMMMNGDLMNNATSGKKGSFLADTLDRSSSSQASPPFTSSTGSTSPPWAAIPGRTN